jgi:hypothetical protein
MIETSARAAYALPHALLRVHERPRDTAGNGRLLVLLDPFRQLVGFRGSLLTIALDESRATLWWSAAVASIYLSRDLFAKPKRGKEDLLS